MSTLTRDRLQEVIDLLDDLLDSDDLNSEEWHAVNQAYHKLETVLTEA